MSVERDAESAQPTADGTPPSDVQGDSGTGKPEAKYTDEDVQRKLRGSGKEIARLKEQLAAFQRAEDDRKQADLSTAEKLISTSKLVEELQAKIKVRDDLEAAELAELAEENEATIKELPKEFRSLVPTQLDPKALAKWLRGAIKTFGERKISVHGGTGRGDAPQTDEEKRKAHESSVADKARAFIFGPSTAGAK